MMEIVQRNSWTPKNKKMAMQKKWLQRILQIRFLMEQVIQKPNLPKKSEKTLGPKPDVRKTNVTDSVKIEIGTTSNVDAKKNLAKKVDESNKGGGGSSSRQPEEKKRRGRGKANSEIVETKSTAKDVDEVNPDVTGTLEEAGLKFVGKDESGKRMENPLLLSLGDINRRRRRESRDQRQSKEEDSRRKKKIGF